jgi:hypothetical protein
MLPPAAEAREDGGMSQVGPGSRPLFMTTTAKRVVAILLALSAAVVGGWATVAPRSFYRSFPLPRHHWVSALGPYNEHLVRDVGGLYLALLVVSVGAAVVGRSEVSRIAGLAWIAFSLPHLLFHLDHLDGFSTADKVGNIVGLGVTLLLAVMLTLPTRGPAVTSTARRPSVR